MCTSTAKIVLLLNIIVPIDNLEDIDFFILPSSNIMLRLHQACVGYETNSHALFPSLCTSLERNFTQDHHISILEGTQGEREAIHLTKMKALMPKLKIVRSEKPLGSPIVAIEGGSPRVQILGIDMASLAVLILPIHIQSLAPSTKVAKEVKAPFKSSLAEIWG
ncbi:LOW QUALITY PROTEIN: hypothetical protein Cgig2_002960 [Carnegiea gigantea]|uniref:Uncharacterized protein n=1 Tax=Carnegiea gigantea TaxID=171969 RepID=A0A9Q1JFS7_9CARY|nr:LOW QUALITY PROTEIN: hypothetical protein Cgig2_002960 [Carnegiea gigantea]